MKSAKMWLLVGGLYGSLAVAFGAFGAHAVEQAIPNWYTVEDLVDSQDSTDQSLRELHTKKMKTWMTGVRYHFYHVFAVLSVGVVLLHCRKRNRMLECSAVCFCTGIIFFSGSIYILVITKISMFGMLAAIGGVFQLIGWVLFCFGIWKAQFELTKTKTE